MPGATDSLYARLVYPSAQMLLKYLSRIEYKFMALVIELYYTHETGETHERDDAAQKAANLLG